MSIVHPSAGPDSTACSRGQHLANHHLAGGGLVQQFMAAAAAQAIANVAWSWAQLDQQQQQHPHQRRQPGDTNNVMPELLRDLVRNHLKHETIAKVVLGGKTQGFTSQMRACATTLKVSSYPPPVMQLLLDAINEDGDRFVAEGTPGARRFCHP
jgi:hypothetical protein